MKKLAHETNNNKKTMWKPTTDQIRILKDLYYNNGIRSPNGDQIQRISASLREYGKIEGKSVLYWFKNHKARERKKKRFNTIINNNTGLVHVPPAPVWKPSSGSAAPYVHSAAVPSNNQHLVYPAGHNQITGEFGYGSTTMKKSFRDCSISAGGSSVGHNFGWAAGGMESSVGHNELLVSAVDQEYGETRGAEIETLSLFPMHTHEDSNYDFCHVSSTDTHDGWFHRDIGGSCASLELSLNLYTGMDRF